MALSRRDVLSTVCAASIIPGCVSQSSSSKCSVANIESVNHKIENSFPYDEFLIVDVSVQSDDAPPLIGELKVCDGEKQMKKDLEKDQDKYKFGPFGHHCPRDWKFWIKGCK